MSLTSKQIDILKVVHEENPVPDVGPVDLDQLLERLPYTTTKMSIQFSIRALIKRGMIEKAGDENRRGRRRRLIRCTATGHNLFAAGSGPVIPSPQGFSEEVFPDFEIIEDNQSILTELEKLA